MRCTVHAYMLNDDFSPEHAEAHFGGKDSENNRRYDWEDELHIKSDVTGILTHEFVSFPLEGTFPDGTAFRHEVSNMRLYEIASSDGPTVFVGASESILERAEQSTEDDLLILRIYLKDYEPWANPIPGIYIASKEFPKELHE
jgi:hypothetical protein